MDGWMCYAFFGALHRLPRDPFYCLAFGLELWHLWYLLFVSPLPPGTPWHTCTTQRVGMSVSIHSSPLPGRAVLIVPCLYHPHPLPFPLRCQVGCHILGCGWNWRALLGPPLPPGNIHGCRLEG